MGFWKDMASLGMAKGVKNNDNEEFIRNGYLYALEEEKENDDEELDEENFEEDDDEENDDEFEDE